MRWLALFLAVVGLAAVGTAAALAAVRGGGPVEVTIRYSRFVPPSLEAVVGQPITVALSNEDPIDHEWIVGNDALHERHRAGTEPVHAERPTEVTVPAGETRQTTVVFDRPGVYAFICHLPGHEAYGMRGTIVVRP